MASLNEGAEQFTSSTGQAANDVEATSTVPQLQGDDALPLLDDSDTSVHTLNESVASIETIVLPSSDLDPIPPFLSMVRPDQPPSLVTDIPIDPSQPAAEQYAES
ncbi:hypothetical protein, partial [Sporisorium scitamineum]